MANEIDKAIKYVQDFKKKRALVKKKVLANPRPFVTQEFIDLVNEQRVLNDIAKTTGTGAIKKFAMIQPDIYQVNPDFWKEQLQDKRMFKQKYPYFVCG